MPQESSPKKPSILKKKIWKFPVWLWLVAAFLVLAIAVGSGGNSSDSPTTPTSQDAATTQAATTQLQEATTQAAAPKLTPQEKLSNAITDKLGDLNRDGPRVESVKYIKKTKDLYITYALNDNFSNNFIRVGAYKDNHAIIQAIRDSGVLVSYLTTNGTFPLQDNLGNPLGEVAVFTMNFPKKSIYEANLDNLPGEMLEGATDPAYPTVIRTAISG